MVFRYAELQFTKESIRKNMFRKGFLKKLKILRIQPAENNCSILCKLYDISLVPPGS